MVDADLNCRLYRRLRDIEAGKRDIWSFISHEALEIVFDMAAHPRTDAQTYYLALLLVEIATDYPEVMGLIEQDVDDCQICAALKCHLQK